MCRHNVGFDMRLSGVCDFKQVPDISLTLVTSILGKCSTTELHPQPLVSYHTSKLSYKDAFLAGACLDLR
jgi:hypothetical protein